MHYYRITGERVITGKDITHTHVFSAQIDYVTLHNVSRDALRHASLVTLMGACPSLCVSVQQCMPNTIH